MTLENKCVYRSKTADIERMLHNSRPESTIVIQSKVPSTNTSNTDSKKYTKRRYTDSRHQTRHIPDADSLVDKCSPSTGTVTAAATATTTMIQQSTTISLNSQGHQRNNNNTTGITTTAPVWKRRELISSAPKDRQSYF